jgi:Zn ribbon nucleic-acid-binding protein
MQRLEEKSSASVGDRTSIVQSVVRHYTVECIKCGFCDLKVSFRNLKEMPEKVEERLDSNV